MDERFFRGDLATGWRAAVSVRHDGLHGGGIHVKEEIFKLEGCFHGVPWAVPISVAWRVCVGGAGKDWFSGRSRPDLALKRVATDETPARGAGVVIGWAGLV
jgi:hypothetical protein